MRRGFEEAVEKMKGTEEKVSASTAEQDREAGSGKPAAPEAGCEPAAPVRASVFKLFLTFFRIGLFTFGGGYAMISIIDDTCVDKNGWITPDEMLDMTVVAESTPGPIAINCATYVGHKQKGLPGALAATLGVVLPSFIIILLISFFLDRFLEITWVANAFRGIKLAVGILIADAGIKLIKKLKKSAVTVTVLVLACAVMLVSEILSAHISSIIMLLAAAVIGVAVYLICGAPADKDSAGPADGTGKGGAA